MNNFPSSSESEEEDLAGLSYDDWYRRYISPAVLRIRCAMSGTETDDANRWMERDEARRIRKNWRHTVNLAKLALCNSQH